MVSWNMSMDTTKQVFELLFTFLAGVYIDRPHPQGFTTSHGYLMQLAIWRFKGCLVNELHSWVVDPNKSPSAPLSIRPDFTFTINRVHLGMS